MLFTKCQGPDNKGIIQKSSQEANSYFEEAGEITAQMEKAVHRHSLKMGLMEAQWEGHYYWKTEKKKKKKDMLQINVEKVSASGLMKLKWNILAFSETATNNRILPKNTFLRAKPGGSGIVLSRCISFAGNG